MKAFGIRRHPSAHELMAYAESLVDRRTTVSAETARHVAACATCAAEVEAMRGSLEFVAQAPDLEPSSQLTHKLLLAAREQRAPRDGPSRAVHALKKGLPWVAGLVIVAAVGAQVRLEHGVRESASQLPNATPIAALSPQNTRKAAEEVQTMAAAVGYPASKPRTPQEWAHIRGLLALDADIAAARAALKRNPGCTRASLLVSTNLRRQAETLKSLYIEKNF